MGFLDRSVYCPVTRLLIGGVGMRQYCGTGRRHIFFSVFTLLSLLALLCALSGCESEKTEEPVVYHSDGYGFSVEIPKELYDCLTILEDDEMGAVRFIYVGVSDENIPVEGDFFRIYAVPFESGTTVDIFASAVMYLGSDEAGNLCYYSWRPTEPLFSTAFRDAYLSYEAQVKAAIDSFAFDSSEGTAD